MKALRLLLFAAVLAALLGLVYDTPAQGASRAAPLPPCPPRPKDPTIPWPPYPCKPQSSPAAAAHARADLRVRLAATPSGTVPASALVSYQIVVRNIGQGRAGESQVTLPFAEKLQTVLDTSFSKNDAWVNSIQSDQIELHLGAIAHDETVTATVRLRTSAAAALGANLNTRASLGWSDARGSGTARSNQVALVVSQAASDRATFSLKVEPAAGSNAASFKLSYDGFSSNERISLWYHNAGGAAVSLGIVQASADGQAVYSLSAKKLAAGRYTVVMYGQFSLVSATGAFTVSEAPAP